MDYRTCLDRAARRIEAARSDEEIDAATAAEDALLDAYVSAQCADDEAFFDKAEYLLERVERLGLTRVAQALKAYLAGRECGSCDFRHVCDPWMAERHSEVMRAGYVAGRYGVG